MATPFQCTPRPGISVKMAFSHLINPGPTEARVFAWPNAEEIAYYDASTRLVFVLHDIAVSVKQGGATTELSFSGDVRVDLNCAYQSARTNLGALPPYNGPPMAGFTLVDGSDGPLPDVDPTTNYHFRLPSTFEAYRPSDQPFKARQMTRPISFDLKVVAAVLFQPLPGWIRQAPLA